jgi:hypothetical protein
MGLADRVDPLSLTDRCLLTSHLTPLTSHLSPLTSHLSPLTSHLSPLTSHLSPLTSHLSPLCSLQAAAQLIKSGLDKKFGAAWHCVIGEGFGFDITYQAKNMIYIVYGTIGILAYKC